MDSVIDIVGTPIFLVLIAGLLVGVAWLTLIGSYNAFVFIMHQYARARRLRADKARWFRKWQ